MQRIPDQIQFVSKWLFIQRTVDDLPYEKKGFELSFVPTPEAPKKPTSVDGLASYFSAGTAPAS